MNELISVIIPVYNTQDYLERCVESVMKQTYSNLEIILVDDGSPDHSGQICDELAQKDARIHVIHQENAGVSAARNAGIEYAHGKYIGFVDSDDYCSPNMYELLHTNLKQRNVKISCCDVCTVSLNGEEKSESNLPTGYLSSEQILNGFFFEESIKGLMYGIYNKLYTTEIVKQSKFQPYRMGEDILFGFQVTCLCEQFYYESIPLYCYCQRENSAMTSSFSEKNFDYIRACEQINNICKEQDAKVFATAQKWLFVHKLNTYRKLIIEEKQEIFASETSELKDYLRQNKEMVKSIAFKRRIDYFLVMYFPFAYCFY